MFRRLQRLATALLRREDGPTAVEYAVMLALVLMALIAGIAQIGDQHDVQRSVTAHIVEDGAVGSARGVPTDRPEVVSGRGSDEKAAHSLGNCECGLSHPHIKEFHYA